MYRIAVVFFVALAFIATSLFVPWFSVMCHYSGVKRDRNKKATAGSNHWTCPPPGNPMPRFAEAALAAERAGKAPETVSFWDKWNDQKKEKTTTPCEKKRVWANQGKKKGLIGS
ncbi:hypothetical protein QBC43DRAFT_313592, partial [Cladorrhinum sp. PSN259]